MRAFVALEIPEEGTIDSLVKMQAELRSTGADLKVVERVNLHFTIKFLGEISDPQAREADSRLKSIKLQGGDAIVEGVGAFPSSSRPSVVWAGVSRESAELVTSDARAVISALEGIGEPDRRPFQPHLTLARVRSDRNLPALSNLLRNSSDRIFGNFTVKGIKLKSSTLTPQGPVYRDIGEYPAA